MSYILHKIRFHIKFLNMLKIDYNIFLHLKLYM